MEKSENIIANGTSPFPLPSFATAAVFPSLFPLKLFRFLQICFSEINRFEAPFGGGKCIGRS